MLITKPMVAAKIIVTLILTGGIMMMEMIQIILKPLIKWCRLSEEKLLRLMAISGLLRNKVWTKED